MSAYSSSQTLLGDHPDHLMEHTMTEEPEHVDEPILDAATARATLRSMAALTRVVLGVALQGPPEQVTTEAVAAPVEPAPRPTPIPDSIAMPAEPPVEALRPLTVLPEPSQPVTALDEEWIPTVTGVPRLAVVDAHPAPERQNIGLLQEIAFLDD